MILGIDGNEANIKNRVGSNVYAYEIIHQLYKIQESPHGLSSPHRRRFPNSISPPHRGRQRGGLTFRVYLKNPPLPDLPQANSDWHYHSFGPQLLWTQWRLPLELYLKKSRPDVFFTPGHYAPRFSPVPSVISIMDLAFLKFPQEFLKKDLRKLTSGTRYSVKQSAHIFAISKSTKADLIAAYKIPENKVSVTYLGFTPQSQAPSTDQINKTLTKFGIKFPYLLFIGTLQPRKNLTKLLAAFAALRELPAYSDLTLVLAGKRGWLYDEIFQTHQQLGLKQSVVFTDFVSDFEKQCLLKDAAALVLPSLYEGFGLPVLEAFHAGTPVVLSRVSSLPEVGGEAALYIDHPESVDSIIQTLVKMLKLTDSERQVFIKKGSEQLKKFTWELCGRETLAKLIDIGTKKHEI